MDITVSRCMKAWLWGSSMATTVVACPLSNRAWATVSTAIGRGALAHADQHGPVADHVDVAALDGGRLVAAVLIAVVGDEVGIGEERMEAVDGPGVQRLALAGRHGHRVDGDAAVDPARVVSLEEVVGERRAGRSRRPGACPTSGCGRAGGAGRP